MTSDLPRASGVRTDRESCPRRAAPTRRLERLTAKSAAMRSTPSRRLGPRRPWSNAAGEALTAGLDWDWLWSESDVTVN